MRPRRSDWQKFVLGGFGHVSNAAILNLLIPVFSAVLASLLAPLFGVALAAVFPGERLSAIAICGAAVVLAATVLIVRV